VRLEVDPAHEAFRRAGLPWLHRLEAIFREQEVVEVEGLLHTVARVLQALSSRGFSRVDHWEVHPGGWIPLPEPFHERLAEPVGHLLNALKSDAWKRISNARAFSVRLSGPEQLRADVVVRRVHREWAHSITVELRGRFTDRDVHGVELELRHQIAIARLRRSHGELAD